MTWEWELHDDHGDDDDDRGDARAGVIRAHFERLIE